MLSGAVDQTEEVVMTAEQESQQVAPEAAGRIHGLAAVFKVSDVVATGEYYRDKLGFTVNFTWGDPPQYVTTSRGDAAIHFAKGEAPTGHNGEASEAYIFVSGIDALYEEIAGRGVKVLMGLETWPYGMREFAVEDLNGYRLCFGEGIEEEAAGD
jgi:predicted enzyme related to lactoylglutathione lyase